ncbi:hypothetical protein [Mycoplasma sp. HU2014]|uniref:hypothetical protein n=1 Tax=Mycoplasma sp. HU2014 TaxID=1664275 RepID=UPI000AC156EE|nr:hypothetical protein [Mycoplasma sp. HU2014]
MHYFFIIFSVLRLFNIEKVVPIIEQFSTVPPSELTIIVARLDFSVLSIVGSPKLVF